MILQRKINGHIYGHSSIECNIRGIIFPAFQEIDYSHKLTPGTLFARGIKVARTRGQYAPEDCSIKLYKGDWNHLRSMLGAGFMGVSFPISVSFGEPGEPLITDTLLGCRVMMPKTSSSQDSTDAIMTELTLDVMKILENGSDPVEPGGLPGVIGSAVNAIANILP